ncbi:acetyl-CoA synthetase-like protein [Polyplosphaeria fusca]|uniref:Acetyl-CoA synthetase-like protein n=1 Tax=Polyplosphaeria fusca TaxID=682080 RepID=A0A9P4V507_9PLEO|nr:acetyl-CoA synthetase-like protein [Polyplosphaeria fusca]
MSFWNTVMDSSGDVPYGKRLLPVIIDEIAKTDPDRVCFSFPRTSDLADGFQDVNFRTFANAVNKTAHFVHQEVGRSSMFETVLYMGYPDIRHFIALIALMKTGHKALYSSHRNSVAGHADLIKRTDCTIILHTSGFPVSGILEKCRLETLCMPDLDYLLTDSPSDHYPYTRTWEEARNHPCMVIHTSGSNGLPKPVVWTHAMLTLGDNHHLVPALEGRPAIWGTFTDNTRRSFCAVPVFHGAGIASGIKKAVFNRAVTVIGPPGLPTADMFAQVIEYGDIDSASCVPISLEEMSLRTDVLEKLRRLKYITYVGGSMSREAGDSISQYVPTFAVLASTETSVVVQHATDPEDWQYICLNPAYNGIEMRPAGPDLFELVFVRDAALEEYQGVFRIFPRLKEYSTADLYSKHPTKPHHWKHEGRKDDMIIFKNGWNFNPKLHEDFISTHQAVQNCVLVGTGKLRPAALIELRAEYYTEEEEKQQAVLDAIWPRIEKANSYADTTGQLEKDHVIFSKKEKPFAIAGKGTVQRKMTVKMYEDEIEKLYNIMGELKI